jgi:hypothetical protein
MRPYHSSIIVCLLLFLASACSHDDEHNPYDTYQDCFDDHIEGEGFPVQQSIVICCLDHPIGSMANPVCGNSTANCATYLGANLSQASATSGDISAGCQEYVNQKNM